MTIYAKVEGFLYYPAFSYGMALTGFIGQNLGAGQTERIRRAMGVSLKVAVGFTLAASLVLVGASRCILLCFTKAPAFWPADRRPFVACSPGIFSMRPTRYTLGG